MSKNVKTIYAINEMSLWIKNVCNENEEAKKNIFYYLKF